MLVFPDKRGNVTTCDVWGPNLNVPLSNPKVGTVENGRNKKSIQNSRICKRVAIMPVLGIGNGRELVETGGNSPR